VRIEFQAVLNDAKQRIFGSWELLGEVQFFIVNGQKAHVLVLLLEEQPVEVAVVLLSEHFEDSPKLIFLLAQG